MPKPSTPPGDAPPVPPPFRGADKRSTILRAALGLFLRDGYTATSMDAVTRAAGVSKATVYAHFEGKQKLFEALVREGSESALSVSPPLARRGGDPADELAAFFEPLVRRIFSGGHAWSRMVLAEATRHPENAELFFACTVGRITAEVERYFADLAREGFFAPGEVRSAAEALLSLVLLGPLHRALLLGPGAVDYRASIRFGIGLLLRDGPGRPG